MRFGASLGRLLRVNNLPRGIGTQPKLDANAHAVDCTQVVLSRELPAAPKHSMRPRIHANTNVIMACAMVGAPRACHDSAVVCRRLTLPVVQIEQQRRADAYSMIGLSTLQCM